MSDQPLLVDRAALFTSMVEILAQLRLTAEEVGAGALADHLRAAEAAALREAGGGTEN